MTIRSRKPTGQVPYPLVLVEGEEKAGKTWTALLLSASEKVGQTYVLDLGEGSADEYGAIPGVRFEILEHDGTWAQITEQVAEVKSEAQRVKDAGEPPVVLVIDTMTDEWEGLKDWASTRAKASTKNKARLAQDPSAEVDVSRNLWNDAGNRHRRLMTQLLTFPGVVVVTARGKEVSATDPDTGQPYRDGRKDYRVEAHRTLPYDATLWLRLFRTRPPVVVGARSVHAGVKPGKDDPAPIEGEHDNLLEWLIFDVLRVDAATAHVRDVQAVTGGALTAEESAGEVETDGVWFVGWQDRVNECKDDEALRGLFEEMVGKHTDRHLTDDDRRRAGVIVNERRSALLIEHQAKARRRLESAVSA